MALPALGCMHGAARLRHGVLVQPVAADSTAAGATTSWLHLKHGNILDLGFGMSLQPQNSTFWQHSTLKLAACASSMPL